ncbi:MAG: hypothetical protein F6K28_07130 [Microcoleus sp. SIO2G3]|nr:hypothetical protein [Microcoleus sp. SIO2G3]
MRKVAGFLTVWAATMPVSNPNPAITTKALAIKAYFIVLRSYFIVIITRNIDYSNYKSPLLTGELKKGSTNIFIERIFCK